MDRAQDYGSEGEMSHLELQLDLLIDDDGLPTPTPEHRFHPVRKWRFDRAWIPYKVAVEVEGGTFSGGRHVRGLGFQKDCTKYNEAALLGWIVLRVTARHIEDGRALVWLRRALTERGWRDGDGRDGDR